MSGLTLLRLEKVLAEYGRTIVVVLLVCGLAFSGLAAWTYTHPPTTEVTDHTERQTVHSELHTRAVATGNTSMYEAGTKLKDQPAYLRPAAPEVTLSQRTSVPQNQSVRVDQRLRLRYQVAHDGNVVWTESRPLAANTTTTSGGEVTTTTSLRVRDVERRLAEISSDVGQSGSVQVDVVVSITYRTEQYGGNLTTAVPVRFSGSWYTIRSKPLERTHSTPVTRTVPVPRDPLGYGFPAALGGASLLVAGAVVARRRRGFDTAGLEHELQQRRYSEWISEGSLSGPSPETTVAIDSLADLVEVAIDLDSRVVHDPSEDVYVVVSDSVMYHFSPDEFLFGPLN